jgi:hypothetical protein
VPKRFGAKAGCLPLAGGVAAMGKPRASAQLVTSPVGAVTFRSDRSQSTSPVAIGGITSEELDEDGLRLLENGEELLENEDESGEGLLLLEDELGEELLLLENSWVT